MNIFSFFATMTAVLYYVLLVNRASNSKGDTLVQVSLGVFACLGWWAFCDAFFYVAKTEEAAWFWLHLGAIGWSGFIPMTAYYFIVMCGDDKVLNTWFRKGMYWIPAIVVTVLFIMPGSTALADHLVQSGSGLGWTYQQSFQTVWPFLLFAELFLYLGVALLRLYLWQRRMDGSAVQTLSTGFIILDILSVAVGAVAIYIIPSITSFLPPLSFIATLIFLYGYWHELRDHDLMHIEMALDPGKIFETSMDAMLIVESDWNIMYANDEAKRILGIDDPRGRNFLDSLTREGQNLMENFTRSDMQRSSSMDLILENHTPLLCSISRTTTRKQGHEVFILSLHDTSSLKEAERRLNYLAYYDELTGLPNRRKLGEILNQWEENYRQLGDDFSILFLDINYFKRINDYFGHSAGDAALQVIAENLRKILPKGDIVTRLAGDEFIVIHDLKTMPSETLVERIHEIFDTIDCTSFAPGLRLETSIGCCKYSEAGNVRELFKLADERMYDIKNKRHTQEIRIFTE